ncbi:MAG: DNA primase [Actinomycetota bacterium]
MAGRIRQDDIDAVRARTDLVRLAQQYVALKKAGQRYVGLCPFHTEKTGSFGISPDKQLFYCHGCGKGGDAIHFLREIEGLDFAEAVERLASQAGITVRYEGASPGERRAAGRRQALHAANERAGELYNKMLLEGGEGEGARRYLADRGLTRESIEAFGIGFAPGNPDFLLKRLARDLSTEILVEAGLALKDARGQVRDRFRARIMFPIHDLSGKAVGFGARLLEGDGPKYLNSPETPIYKKGELLYNLHRAKNDVTRTGRGFVVEGYTDVIALAQAGIPTAVATCGTALSEGHFRLLSRFCRRAILSFDSDEAGARAAERAHGMFEEFGLEVSVLILPEGQDPADFVLANGGDEFDRLADKAQPVVEYMLERAVRGTDLTTPEGQAQAVRAALPIVDGLQDHVLRARYTGVLAGLAGVSDTVVMRELQRMPREGRAPAAARPAEQVDVPTPAKGVEKEILKILAQYPHAVGALGDHVGDEHFTTERSRKAWNLLRQHPDDPTTAAAETGEKGLPELIAELSVEPLRGEPVASYIERVFARLDELTLKRKMDTLRKRLERLNPVTDAPTFDPLFSELSELTGRWRAAKGRAGEGA